MTSPTRYCACGCGTPVNNKWARGHSSRGEGGAPARQAGRVDPLPPPDDPIWDDDAGSVDLGELVPDDSPDPLDAPVTPPAAQPADAGPAAPDPAPAHGKREWRKKPKPAATGKPVRVTAGVRGDINAKLRFVLQVPGTIWQARDPLCGGTFIEQVPDTAEALTDIVCDSTDLVLFFTGPAGAFMRWLSVGAALMPVVQVMAAHHVYHTIEIGEPEPAQSYAA